MKDKKEEPYSVNSATPISRTTEWLWKARSRVEKQLEKLGRKVQRGLKEAVVVERIQRWVPESHTQGLIISVDRPGISIQELEEADSLVIGWGDYLMLSRYLSEATGLPLDERQKRINAFWKLLYDNLGLRLSGEWAERMRKELKIGIDFAERFLQEAYRPILGKAPEELEKEILSQVYYPEPEYFNQERIEEVTGKTAIYIAEDRIQGKKTRKKLYRQTLEGFEELQLPEKADGFKKEWKKVANRLKTELHDSDYPIRILLVPPNPKEIDFYSKELSKDFRIYITPIEEGRI